MSWTSFLHEGVPDWANLYCKSLETDNLYVNNNLGVANLYVDTSIFVNATQFVSSSRAITNAASLNGIAIPASGGTLAKLSDIPSSFTAGRIQVYYDNYPPDLVVAGALVPIGTSVINASNMSVSGDNIFVNSGATGVYSVSVSIPVYKESAFQLYDGNNGAITGTALKGGHPVLDEMTTVLSSTFIISQPALDKFTLRATSNSYVGDSSAGAYTSALSISVQRIA